MLPIFVPVFSVTESYTSEQYVGCDRAYVTTSAFPQFDCASGILKDVVCSPEPYCSAVCSEFISDRCTHLECLDSEVYIGPCGTFVTGVSLGGVYSKAEAEVVVKSLNLCPYDDISSLEIDVQCGGTSVSLFWGSLACIFGETTTEVYVNCHRPNCVLTTDTDVTCEMVEYELEEVYEVPDGGICTPKQQRCEGLKRLTCTSNGEWVEEGARCSELCCDTENQYNSVYCKRISSFISTKKALCVSLEDSDSYFTCDSEDFGDYRCNENIVEKCNNGLWATYENCQYTCNTTATGTGDNEFFCTTYNKIVGGCENFDTFCMKSGGDSFLFTCSVQDWVLTKECGSGRCSMDGESCYEGCGLFTEFCYPENNSCYYCNQLGDYVYDGVCQTEVHNLTLECSSDLSCREGASRCKADWSILCENENWIASDQCAFGCKDGKCVSQDEKIFEPLIMFSDWLVNFVPAISRWIFMMGIVSVVIYLLMQIGRWI